MEVIGRALTSQWLPLTLFFIGIGALYCIEFGVPQWISSIRARLGIGEEKRQPGMSIHMRLRIHHLAVNRRRYIIDLGKQAGERLSFYISASNIFTLSVVDAKGESHLIQIPAVEDGVPLGDFIYLACEVGVAKQSTALSIWINGRKLASMKLSYNVDIAALDVRNGVIGADLRGENGAAFDLVEIGSYSLTLTKGKIKRLAKLYKKAPVSKYVNFNGAQWMRIKDTSGSHANLKSSKAPQAEKEPALDEPPHVHAKLLIEPVDQDSARFRLQIENGKIPVENIRIVRKTGSFVFIEYDQPIMVRMLPADGKLSSFLSPVALKLKDCGNILVDIYFDAKHNGVTRHFISSHRFLLQPEDNKSQTLDPERSNFREGILEGQDKTGEIQQQFLQPEGCLVMVLPEKTDKGLWNIIRGGNNERQIVSDPELKLVSFQTKTLSGRIVSLSTPIHSNAKGMHIVSLSWNPYGGSLGVDGIERKDFEAGHDPDQK